MADHLDRYRRELSSEDEKELDNIVRRHAGEYDLPVPTFASEEHAPELTEHLITRMREAYQKRLPENEAKELLTLICQFRSLAHAYGEIMREEYRRDQALNN